MDTKFSSIKKIIVCFTLTLFVASCSKDEDDNAVAPQGKFDNGVLILNEGVFNSSNSEVSYLADNLENYQNTIFSTENSGNELGDVAQSIGFYDYLAFIVVNNSQKIEIVNCYTFKKIATISSGLYNPRYIAFSQNKGYVTNWGNPTDSTDDFIAVIDLVTYTVSETIPVAEGPEAILNVNDKLYVAHKGGYNFGATVSVLNTTTNTVDTVINVADVPNSLALHNTTLYVLCEGKPAWTGSETDGTLSKIDITDNTVTNLSFDTGKHPNHLTIYNDNLYYTEAKKVYTMPVTSTTLPSAELFSVAFQNNIYGFAVQNDAIFLGDAKNYTQLGEVFVYDLNGTLKTQLFTGYLPSKFYFN